MFHPMGGLSLQEQIDKRTRPFDGTGTPYLKVPGLKSVSGVRVGTLDLPLEMVIRFPANEALEQGVTRLPVVALDRDDAGCPVLLRSILSNDGIWQAGEKNIFVTGEWEVEAEVEERQPATGRRGRA